MNVLIEQVLMKLREPLHDMESISQWKMQMFTFIDRIAELKVSSTNSGSSENISLDPVDWSAARHIAHEMLDASLNFIQTIRDRPVWRPVPEDVRTILEDAPVPERSRSLADVCNDILTYVLPYPRN
ncbi:unnamed protein product [Adineta ricciae]|uniref:Uncharacterized protein n=1 Tax=Adineta ricciae TaxID=249248 RepID=A0A814WYC2_ADIRI|nr:unnamed protein product [Adineta ricciae]